MLTACWSVKGGSGTTTVAAGLTMTLAGHGRPVVAADFGGDLAIALGVAAPQSPGLRDWLDAGEAVPDDGLARIGAPAERGITVVPQGRWAGDRDGSDAVAMRRLARALRALPSGGPVVADFGVVDSDASRAFVEEADRSLLVIRPCYLALRRAVAAPKPTALIVVNEPGRSLSPRDLADNIGAPIAAVVEWDAAVARAVDTGLLRSRLPRRVAHAIGGAAA